MKALVLKAYRELVYEEVPDPVCPPDGVIVRLESCAICGSDVHGLDGSTGRRIPPIIMGHEAAGVIWETGPQISPRFQKGDRVTFDSTLFCGACDYCRAGEVNLCDQRRVLGVSCGEYRLDGTFAQYIALPERALYKLPDAVSLDHAAMIEPLSIAYHAARLAGTASEDTALVVGAGTIGLLLTAVLKAWGVRTVIVSDVSQNRLDTARKMGADTVIHAGRTSVVDTVRELTNGAGVKTSFEAVGLSETVGQAVLSLCKGGTCVLVGNLAAEVTLPLQWVVTRQLQVIGSCASSGEYPDCLALLASGKIDLGALLSASAPLRDGARWFDKLYNREENLIKVVLKPWL